MKTAILVMSDPKAQSEEALGRVFNALAAAHDFKEQGHEVTVLFNGTGTRWIAELSNPEHPLAGLFELTKGLIAGVSCGCADVFGATESVEKSGFDLVHENMIPGTKGLPSVAKLAADGFNVITF